MAVYMSTGKSCALGVSCDPRLYISIISSFSGVFGIYNELVFLYQLCGVFPARVRYEAQWIIQK